MTTPAPTFQRSAVHTVSDIEAIADHTGSHFFSPETMKHFKSRLLTGIRALDGNTSTPGARFLFVTSEKHGDNPRHYAVRLATLGVKGDPTHPRPDIDIRTVGEYHPTPAAARAAMRNYTA